MILQVTKRMGNDEFGYVDITGWTYEGALGLFDSYASALADSMGLWDEYCAYHAQFTQRIGGSRK